jgi:NitT/TauT family transport system substrate-binding protein
VSSTQRRLRMTTLAIAAVAAFSAITACSSSGGDTGSAATGASSSGVSSAAVPTLDPANPVAIHVADAGVSNLLAIAKAQGFFTKNGLDVSLTQTASGVATLAALQGGSLDIGYADLYAGINAISNGFDVQLVENNNTNPTKIPFLVKADGPIKSVADLSGKTIGVAPVPQITVNAKGFLKANGVDPSSVKFTVIADSNGAPQALNRGDYAAWEASPIAVFTNNATVGYNFTTIGKDDTSGWSNAKASTAGWWSTGSYARAHPAVEYAWASSVRQFRKWWAAESDSDKAKLILQYYQVDYNKLSGGDASKLSDLINYVPFQTTAIDLDATQSWYDLGVQYDGEQIAKGVDWKKHVFASATAASPGV